MYNQILRKQFTVFKRPSLLSHLKAPQVKLNGKESARPRCSRGEELPPMQTPLGVQSVFYYKIPNNACDCNPWLNFLKIYIQTTETKDLTTMCIVFAPNHGNILIFSFFNADCNMLH